MAKSTVSSRQNKPKKPYPDFPMYAHATKRWAKRIRGKIHYFGSWNDPQGALERFNREWPYLSDGRTPPPVDTGDACTLRLLCNSFLTSKQRKLDSGGLSKPSFADYLLVCQKLIDHFDRDRRVDDLRPDDFEWFRSKLSETLGPIALGNQITRCRSVFKYALDQRMIDSSVVYGQAFDKPSAKMLRRARNEAGQRMFEADELRRILDAADPIMRALVLLGVNCGFGNSDVANLPQLAVGFKNGWITYPRPKTEIQRRVPLWLETVKALQDAVSMRPEPKDPADAGLCFIAKRGERLVRTKPSLRSPEKFVTVNGVSPAFSRLLKRLKINGRRGLNFYSLRHVFETIAGESRDQVAVNAIMGHVDSSMAAVYRERISDERLKAVTDTVHQWLFPKKRKRTKAKKAKRSG